MLIGCCKILINTISWNKQINFHTQLQVVYALYCLHFPSYVIYNQMFIVKDILWIGAN